jgi:fucose 4-O-acetylase-like acetyltransferase
MKQRIEYIDVAKGIGIILVAAGIFIYSANGGIRDFAVSWIYSFHMPLFFFISGFLFTASNKNFTHLSNKKPSD